VSIKSWRVSCLCNTIFSANFLFEAQTCLIFLDVSCTCKTETFHRRKLFASHLRVFLMGWFVTFVITVLHTAVRSHQWRTEVWWCPGRLLDWMPLYQILVLNSGVWWSLLLDMRCLWRHNMTSYSRLQTNVLAKLVDTTCIFRNAGAAVAMQPRRHGGLLRA